jgi:hypothetical protein
LEVCGGWFILNYLDIVWKEQESGENYIMRSLFGSNRRLEKFT